MKPMRLILVCVLLLFSLSSCALMPKIALSETETELGTETQEEIGKTLPDVMQKYDPKEDSVINVLMIGSSSCYYYVEELYGMAKVAGVNMTGT